MWMGIQIATTMTAVAIGSMASGRGSGTAAAATGASGVMAGLVVGVTVRAGIGAEELPIS